MAELEFEPGQLGKKREHYPFAIPPPVVACSLIAKQRFYGKISSAAPFRESCIRTIFRGTEVGIVLERKPCRIEAHIPLNKWIDVLDQCATTAAHVCHYCLKK